MDPFPPTEQQRAVIEHRGGNLLIFAGPGTGKTETLARRFASLVVDDKVPADQILVLTFSRRAADEMRDRVRLRLRQRSGAALAVPELFVKTFHSFCARLLEGDGRGAPQPLLTPVKERLLWRRAAHADRIKLASLQPEVLASGQFATDCLNVITQLKGRAVDPLRLQAIAVGDERLQDVAALYAALDAARQGLGLRDFRDLVVDAVRALDDAAGPAAHWLVRAGFRHILVDEFQDSDPIDLRLLEQLARVGANQPQFCFVGDVNQSIYRFRGASPENVRAAQRLFECEVLPLHDNRRSAQAVLDVANADASLDRASLTHAAERSKNGSVTLIRPRTIDDEVRAVADAIALRIAEHETAPRDIAVLLRQSFPYRELIVAALHARGLPVAALPAAGFYDDSLVDGALTALRLLAAPGELSLWRRLLVNPIIGYRAVDVSNAFDGVRGRNAAPSEDDILAALRRRPPYGPHPITWFLQSWKHCGESYRSGDPVTLLRRVVSELDLLRPLREPEPVAGFDPIASPLRLQALLTAAQDHTDIAQLPQADGAAPLGMTDFIERLDETVGLLADANEPPASIVDGIRVMSIHAAKGLEFDFVIIPQAIDGILPADERPNRILTDRSVAALRRAGVAIFADGAGSRAEEHALWYVALTRARTDVLVSAAQFDDDGVEQLLSPFAAKVPAAVEPPAPAGVQLVVHAGGNGERRSDGAQQPTLPGLVASAGIALGLPSLSPSSINTFVTCPRRFFYGDVLRLPRSDDDDASVHGQLLHAILRRFHERYTDFSQVDDPTAAAQEYAHALFALIDDELATAMPHAEQSAMAQFERHDLRVRLDMYAEQLADDASRHPFVVLGCEQSLSSRLHDVVVLGRADRIDRLVGGGLAIRDYKSGSNRGKKSLVETLALAFSRLDAGEDLFGDAPDGLNLQLLLYVRGAEQLYGDDVRRLDYWYFRGAGGQKNELRLDATWLGAEEGQRLSRADIERVERDVAERIARMCNDGRELYFPTAKDERVCRYCDYVAICPGVGAVTA